MTTLHDAVTEWLKEQREDGYEEVLDDLLSHGCESGMVSHLVYYTDTVAFYEEHQKEIDEILGELCDDCGTSPAKLFGDKWDESDPLARDDLNKNLLAWFGFEEMAHRIDAERPSLK